MKDGDITILGSIDHIPVVNPMSPRIFGRNAPLRCSQQHRRTGPAAPATPPSGLGAARCEKCQNAPNMAWVVYVHNIFIPIIWMVINIYIYNVSVIFGQPGNCQVLSMLEGSQSMHHFIMLSRLHTRDGDPRWSRMHQLVLLLERTQENQENHGLGKQKSDLMIGVSPHFCRHWENNTSPSTIPSIKIYVYNRI